MHGEATQETQQKLQAAAALRRQGRLQEAARLCGALLRDAPERAEVRVELGNLLLASGRQADAAARFEQALAMDPAAGAAWEGLGLARAGLGASGPAIEAFQRALAVDPNSAVALANLGGLLLEAGRISESVPALRQAVALMPTVPGLQANLGLALCAEGAPEAAVAAFDAALALDPGLALAVAGKGFALATAGRQEAAAEILDFERFVVARRLDQLDGYDSPADFNRALAAAVLAEPSLQPDPGGKTTRIGAQSGELMGRGAGPFAVLERQFRAATEDYHRRLAALPGAPFPVPLPRRFRLRAWATVLDPGGYQDPHHHPGPVTSGVYYVQFPAAEGDAEQGAIEFGRPPEGLGLTAAIAPRLVRPEEGLLVLFPSYFWHRTLPTRSRRQRISIAFDAWPEA